MLNTVIIRKGIASDEQKLKSLYRRVAAIPGGLARTEDEVTDDYMHLLIKNALGKGFLFIAEHAGELVGMIVAYRVGPQALAHVLKDVTVLVDPGLQGQGIGGALIKTLLDEVQQYHPEILRIELFTRETNPALRLYERMGFVQEGRFEQRIKNPDGTYVADIPMAWKNPLFYKNLKEK